MPRSRSRPRSALSAHCSRRLAIRASLSLVAIGCVWRLTAGQCPRRPHGGRPRAGHGGDQAPAAARGHCRAPVARREASGSRCAARATSGHRARNIATAAALTLFAMTGFENAHRAGRQGPRPDADDSARRSWPARRSCVLLYLLSSSSVVADPVSRPTHRDIARRPYADAIAVAAGAAAPHARRDRDRDQRLRLPQRLILLAPASSATPWPCAATCPAWLAQDHAAPTRRSSPSWSAQCSDDPAGPAQQQQARPPSCSPSSSCFRPPTLIVFTSSALSPR